MSYGGYQKLIVNSGSRVKVGVAQPHAPLLFLTSTSSDSADRISQLVFVSLIMF
jgi:hypothetical protein